MSKNPVLLAAVAICAASSGYWLGSQSGLEVDEAVVADREGESPVDEVLEGRSVTSVTENLGKTAPSVSLDGVFRARGGQQASTIDAYLSGMNPSNASEYIEEIQALPAGRRHQMILSKALLKWGEIDGENAFEYAYSMKGRARMQYLSSAAAGWAAKEPEAAWAAIMDTSNYGAIYGLSANQVLDRIGRDNLELAARLAFETENRSTFARSRMGVLVNLADDEAGYKQLLECVQRFADDETKSKEIEHLFKDWGQYDSEAPSASIQTLLDEDLSQSAMTGLLAGWANADPAGAFAYAAENQADPAVAESLQQIVRTWVQSATREELLDIPSKLAQLDDYERILTSAINDFIRGGSRSRPRVGERIEGRESPIEKCRQSDVELVGLRPGGGSGILA